MDFDEKSLRVLIDALRKKGYRATPQRMAICKFALQTPIHPTVKTIYKKVREEHPTISIATIYKTLKILKELDLIQELTFPKRPIRFDPYMKPHINLVCSKCNAIIDFDDPAVQSIIKRVADTAKFQVTGQRLDIYGICEKCRKASYSKC